MNNQIDLSIKDCESSSSSSFSSSSTLEMPKYNEQNRLSKSLDSFMESSGSYWNAIFSKELSATVPAYSSREERSDLRSENLSSRAFEVRKPVKLLKGKSNKSLNKRVFLILEKNLSFPIVTIEKIRTALNNSCIKAFEKVHVEDRDNLYEWLSTQAEQERIVLARKPHLWGVFESNLNKLKVHLDIHTEKETTKKLQRLKEAIRSAISDKIGSIGDFAVFYKTTISQFPEKYKKDFSLIFYRAIAGDDKEDLLEKRANAVLEFFAKWSRDPKGLEELIVAFYNSYLARKSFHVFTGPLQQLDIMKISLNDVRRHLIMDNVLQIKKVVVDESPINDLDLFEDKQCRILKKNQDVVFYQRVIEAICKKESDDKDVEELMTAEQFSDIKNPMMLKIANLMRSGTINFWKLSHDKLLGILHDVESVKVSQDRGTTWNIQIENTDCFSLNQIKNYRVQELSQLDESNKLLSIHLQCLTHFDFKEEQIKSSLTISAITPKDDMSDLEHELVLKVLGFPRKV